MESAQASEQCRELDSGGESESSNDTTSKNEWKTPEGSDAGSINGDTELDFDLACLIDFDDTVFP